MFREDIEGLRGVAVLFVIIYHFDLNIFCGGYIGVDIFFVISGYLITGIILNKIQKNNFRFITFYSNRFKRILPDSVFVLCVVVFYLYKHNDISYKTRIYKDCLYALLFNANTNYYFQSLDYYKSFQKQTPILHYWSLSLEEQFYFIYPFVVYYFNRYNFNIVLILLFVISLYICVKYSYINRSFSYFIILSRAWQLFAGCIAKLYEKNISFIETSNISLFFLIYISNFYNKYIIYPGLYSLLPIILSILIIKEKNEYNILLESKLIRKCGEMSFTLYLVHYPIIVIINNNNIIFKSLLVIIISIILYKVIEKPFHYSNLFYTYFNPLILGITIITIVSIVLLQLIHQSNNELHNIHRFSKYNYSKLKQNMNNLNRRTCNLCCKNEYTELVFSKHIFLLGDSHARGLIFSISNYAKEYGWKIYHRFIPSINIITNNVKLYNDILGKRIYDLIITTYKYPTNENDRKKFEMNFKRNLKFIISKTKNVIVVDDNPSFFTNTVDTLVQHKRDYENINENCIASPPFNIFNDSRIKHFNFSKYYYRNDKCLLLYNNTVMYVDNNHLSIELLHIIGKELFNFILTIHDFHYPKVRNSSLYTCDYFIPQFDPHYKHCKKC